MRRLAKTFLQADSRYLRERVSDVWDLERRVLRHLIGEASAELAKVDRPTALVAHDLTPSQTAALDKQHIRAIATDAGGRTSHTAILAHALGIPAIVGLGKASALINSGDTIIVDGNRGLVVIDPDAARLMEYRQEVRRLAAFEEGLDELKDLPAVTTDGVDIELLANIEFPTEIGDALGRGAQGIGLYRTEFLFLAADTSPSEDEQYETYVAALGPGRQAHDHPHPRPRRRQGPRLLARVASTWPRNATPSSACGRSGCACRTCRCSRPSSAPSSAPRPRGRPASCSP